MSETTAVVITAPGEVGLHTVRLKQPGPDDVVIETLYTSISAGTERMLLAGQMPHPMLQLPVVPGYETVGTVVAVGDKADPALIGQTVYVGGAMCYDGINGAWGGQAARLFAPAARVVPLGEVNPRHGVLLALAATALHGVDLAALTEGDRVLVIGQGPVGQLAARLASANGAWVAVSDRNATRLRLADADLKIDVTGATLNDALTEPVDVIIEAAGSMAALSEALPHLAQAGLIVLLGYYQDIALPYMPLFLKEARLQTAKEWAPGDLARCRDMIASGTLDVAPLITHELAINAVTDAYDTAMNDLDCLKLVLHWGERNGGAA